MLSHAFNDFNEVVTKGTTRTTGTGVTSDTGATIPTDTAASDTGKASSISVNISTMDPLDLFIWLQTNTMNPDQLIAWRHTKKHLQDAPVNSVAIIDNTLVFTTRAPLNATVEETTASLKFYTSYFKRSWVTIS